MIGLGSKGLQFTRRDHSATVEKLHAGTDRKTHNNCQIRVVSRAGEDFFQPLFHRIMERILHEQIAAGIAGHGKFRKQQNIYILSIRFLHKIADVFCVFLHIGNLYLRHSAGNTNIIQHGIPSILLIFYIISHNAQFAKKISKAACTKQTAFDCYWILLMTSSVRSSPSHTMSIKRIALDTDALLGLMTESSMPGTE